MSSSEVKELEDLKKRRDQLEREKIRSETEAQHLESERTALLQKIKDTFGVDTLDDLRALSESKKEEARKMLQEFSASIAGVERKLKEVEASD